MFSVYFPTNFFYSNVVEKWETIVKRMKLPYESVCDFMNNQIQSVTFPALNLDNATQQRWNYEVAYAQGKELEPVITKTLTMTFKLTESYASYFIMWDQLDTYLHYHSRKELPEVNPWLEPITLSFLTDSGHKLTSFIFREITPKSLSDLNLSYAAQIASYNNFNFTMMYNRFDIE